MSRNSAKSLAVLLYALPIVAMLSIGVAFLLTPEPTQPTWHAIARVADVPDDGHPVRLPVVSATYDAWSRLPERRIGAVFVRKLPGVDRFRILEPRHSRLSIAVVYDPEISRFKSCCRVLQFNLDGEVITTDRVTPGLFENMRSVPHQVLDGELLVQHSR